MKLTYTYVISMFIFLCLAGCKSDDKPVFELSVDVVTLPAEGGEWIIDISSPSEWSLRRNRKWVEMEKLNEYQFKVRADVNTGPDRLATVEVLGNNLMGKLLVTQNSLDTDIRDSIALLSIYHATGGEKWTNTWDLNRPISTWYGVTVAEERVVSLSLGDNNLTGIFPQYFNLLDRLEHLDLSGNALTGDVAFILGDFPELEYLDLSRNRFTAQLPFVDSLRKLVVIDLSRNQFEGEIHASYGELPNLHFLDLSNNNLEGDLPRNFACKGIKMINVSNNQLFGNIPGEWFDTLQIQNSLTALENLYLYNNKLVGEIPEGLPLVTKNYMRKLYLDMNQISGMIPKTFSEYLEPDRSRVDIILSNNYLDGDITWLKELYGDLWGSKQGDFCTQRDRTMTGCENTVGTSGRISLMDREPTVKKEMFKIYH